MGIATNESYPASRRSGPTDDTPMLTDQIRRLSLVSSRNARICPQAGARTSTE